MENKTLIRFLQKTLHTEVYEIETETEELTKIPFVLRHNYPMFNIKMYDQPVSVAKVLNPSLGSVKKHYELLSSAVDRPIILYFSKDARILRNYLIERNIPFVIENDTIYLPQFAIYASDLSKPTQPKKKRAKFSRSAQRALLYILYHLHQEFTISQLAQILKMSEMSASRALNELYEQKILDMRKEGRVKQYSLTKSDDIRRTILDKMKAPMSSIIYINREDLQYFHPIKLSGGSALEKYTDLIETMRTYAVEKRVCTKILKENPSIEVFDEAYDRDFIKIEMWDYLLENFMNDTASVKEGYKYVDPISLYLNYKKEIQETSDVRLEIAIEQLLDKIQEILHG